MQHKLYVKLVAPTETRDQRAAESPLAYSFTRRHSSKEPHVSSFKPEVKR